MIFRAALLSACLLLLPASALAGEFDAKQRDEIGAIVRGYLLKNPEILLEISKELEKRQQVAEDQQRGSSIAQHADEIFRSKADLVVGNPKGDVTIVEFFDYNCPWCKKSMPELQKLLKADPNIRLVLKEFPILGEGSEYAARAALASQSQGKYWQFHQALFAHEGKVSKDIVDEIAKDQGLDVAKLKADMGKPEFEATVKRNQALAQTLGINGTPGFVVGDKLIPGFVPGDNLAAAVKEIRDAGGCAVC